MAALPQRALHPERIILRVQGPVGRPGQQGIHQDPQDVGLEPIDGKEGGAMGLLRMVVAVLFVAAGLAFPAAAAAQTPSIKGGGTTEEMTQFALAISAGRGHFECLMPALMNVQATVIGAEVTGGSSVSFEGTAYVTLPAGNPLD